MQRRGRLGSLALCAILLVTRLQASKKAEREEPSAIDRYVLESTARSPVNHEASPGSVYSTVGQFADLGRDVRANQVDDLVTIVVFDRASALCRGRRWRVGGQRQGVILLGDFRAAFGRIEYDVNCARPLGQRHLCGARAVRCSGATGIGATCVTDHAFAT